jgi:hypothetical protein
MGVPRRASVLARANMMRVVICDPQTTSVAEYAVNRALLHPTNLVNC